jgi:hypothetical protein
MRVKVLTVCLMFTSATQTPAGGFWMNEQELQKTFAGQRVEGEYKGGSRFQESYSDGGLVSYEDENRESGGKWSIQAGTFCTIYDDDTQGGCYRVRRSGDNCYEFYFVARTEDEARKEPRDPSWTARAWFSSKPATCVDGESV